jgi:hypothetical protein
MGSVLAAASIAATPQKIFVTIAARARSYLSKAQRSASKQQTKPTMKRNLLAVVAAGA